MDASPGDGSGAPPQGLAGRLVNGLPLAMAVVDEDFRFLWLNDRLATLNGLPAPDHLGRRVRDVVPGLWPLLEPRYVQVRDTGVPALDVETSGSPTVGGRTGHWSASYFPVPLPHGGRGVGVLVVDATATREAEAERDRFASVVRTSEDFIAIVGLDAGVLYVNPAGRALVQMPPDAEVAGTRVADFLTPDGLVQSETVERSTVLTSGRWHGQGALRDWAGGDPIDVEIDSWLLRHPRTDDPMAFCTIRRDIRGRRAVEARLRRRAKEQEAVAALCQRALTIEDEAALLEEAARTVASTLAVRQVDVLEVQGDERPVRVACSRLLPAPGEPEAADDDAVDGALADAAAEAVGSERTVVLLGPGPRGEPGSGENRRCDVTAVPVLSRQPVLRALATCSRAAGEATTDSVRFLESVAAVVGAASDRLAAERSLREQALHDSLTGLPNRALILDRLDHSLAQALREGTRVAVMLLDVDEFKAVNDSYGHETGDMLLVSLGAALRAALRPQDTVARLGGDEFLILFDHLPDEATAVAMANRLRRAWAVPFDLAVGARLHMTACLGVALSHERSTAPSMLREADAAMYRGKARGRDQIEVYDQRMQAATVRRLALEQDLRRAVAEQQLDVVYQPVVTLADDRVVGYEALARWQHPEHGDVPPAEFVAIAEETGFVDAVGRFVQQRVCEDLQRQRGETGAHPVITLNVSTVELRRPDFAADLAGEMWRHGVPARALGVEITEDVVLDSTGQVYANVVQLADMGVDVLLDDFGTGLSSLSHVQRMPVSTLKIDRSFVAALPDDPGALATVEAIVALAQAFGLRTVAEGVETAEQAVLLTGLGCDRAQGYLFGRPEPWRTMVDEPEGRPGSG